VWLGSGIIQGDATARFMDDMFMLLTPSYQQAAMDPLLVTGPQVPVIPSSNGAGPWIQMILDGLHHVQDAQALFTAATAMVSGLVNSPVVTGSTLLPGYTLKGLT
jgi:hypothetical protein